MKEEQQYPHVSVVIPTHNEAQNLRYVLPYIPPIVSEVILVDGHSIDDTIAVAKQLLPTIQIIKQTGRGKGNALRAGFAACTGEIIVMLDADGSTDPNEIPRFVEALLEGNDFAKGSRFIKGGGSHDITPLRSLGNCGLSQLVNILFGTVFTDLCYGYNAFWKYCLDRIEIDCDGFEIETLINIRVHKANLKVIEVPSFERPRIFGQSNLRTFRDGWRVLRTIMKERARSFSTTITPSHSFIQRSRAIVMDYTPMTTLIDRHTRSTTKRIRRDREPSMYHPLQKRISERTLCVAVIGLGYVGLPLATVFAEIGFHVTGIDVDQQKVDRAARGESYIPDVLSSVLRTLIDADCLHFTSEYAVLDNVDVVVICVPTPLGKTRDPDISYVVSATREVRKHLHSGQLVILESTTYPGITDEVILPELESTGLKVGIDFFLAFSPERIDPGNADFHIQNTPKIVGGITNACTELAYAFYGAAIEKVIPVSSSRVAEMAKLLENTFRAVNIGLVNEIAMICEKLNINVWEVIDAAATKPFGFMRFLPGPGLGGHCIPVDPHYLSWKLKTLDYTTRFIQLAAEINHSMPHYVLNKIGGALNEQCRSFNGSTILLLGVAYKRNIGDVRESPALDIIRALRTQKSIVCYNDEYVPSLLLGEQTFYSQPLSSGLLQSADCVVIVTDHSYYDVSWIVREARYIVDTRNMTRMYQNKNILLL